MTLDSTQLRRLSTGVPGLDRVLAGGLFERSVYILDGPPGAGKTILGNQMCHHHAAQGAEVVYLTLLAESHARMIAHLRTMSFFRADLVAKTVHYVSGFKVLENEGLSGLLRVMRETVTPRKATLLVIDGLASAVESAATNQEYRKFIHELQALAALSGCTVLLLVNRTSANVVRAEDTIVDGIIELMDEVHMLRPLRHLQIRKLRGADPVRGKHTLVIDKDGASVLPRIEAQLLRLPEDARLEPGAKRVGFGIGELDHMLSGGLPACSTTMLLGPTGTGKTILSLQFLDAGAAAGERGLFFGFYERPHTLIEKSRRIGLDLDRAERKGLVRFAWQAFGEASIDVLGERLLRLIREQVPRRLCIDGMQGFQQAVDFPERLRAVLSAIVDALEAQHITTLYTVESNELEGPLIHPPISGISAVTHNIILLRHLEWERERRKVLSVLKLRDSGFDASLRELRVTDRGVVMGGDTHADVVRTAGGEPRRGAAASEDAPRSRRAAPAGPRVVIVDDEFGLAELVAEILTENGYLTAIAINGELGLALLRETGADLVLVDLMMPVLNGREMLREMRADPKLANIPTVIMTALPEAVPTDEGTFAAVLQKPFTPERLFEVVKASVRSGNPGGPESGT
jgi:circadian clock protein KaiC